MINKCISIELRPIRKQGEDLGEMMFNLAEFHRVKRDENDTLESFVGGYDFEEAFLGPFQT